MKGAFRFHCKRLGCEPARTPVRRSPPAALRWVGPAEGSPGQKLAGQIGKLVEPPGFTGKQPGEVRTQFGHRMGEWQPLKPALVAEVQYDHFTGGRFRHGARFLRWRPDKEAGDCILGQIRQ